MNIRSESQIFNSDACCLSCSGERKRRVSPLDAHRFVRFNVDKTAKEESFLRVIDDAGKEEECPKERITLKEQQSEVTIETMVTVCRLMRY